MRSSADSNKPLLIALAGRTYPQISRTAGEFVDWIAAGLGDPDSHLRIDAQAATALPPPTSLAGVVVSGSPAMVTDREPWSERLAAWLRDCVTAQVPVLGICYGHQLLAHAMGGRVDYRPDGLEIGTHPVELARAAADDALFAAAPPTFPAHFVHSQSVRELPPGATLLAGNAQEPHQAFRVGACAWGVQFHPEFSADVMRGYIHCRIERQEEAAALLAAVRVTPEAASLLSRFATLARRGLAAAYA